MDVYGISVLAIAVLAFVVIRWRTAKYPKNVRPTQTEHESKSPTDSESCGVEIKHYSGTKLGEMGMNPATGKYGRYMGGGAWLE